MKLEALIFDVDGTLADTEEAHRRSFNEAFSQHGLEWNWSKPTYAHLLATTGGKERLAVYLASLPVSVPERATLAASIPLIHRTKTENYRNLVMAGEVALRPGVARLMDEASRRGVRLALATTTTFANIEALLQTHWGADALARFAAIGSGDDVPRKKPAPDIYQHVLAELGLPPTACVAIEDSANGLRSARDAGLFTIVTPSYWTQSEDFSDADLVLPSLGSMEHPLPRAAAALLSSPLLGIEQIDDQLRRIREFTHD